MRRCALATVAFYLNVAITPVLAEPNLNSAPASDAQKSAGFDKTRAAINAGTSVIMNSPTPLTQVPGPHPLTPFMGVKSPIVRTGAQVGLMFGASFMQAAMDANTPNIDWGGRAWNAFLANSVCASPLGPTATLGAGCLGAANSLAASGIEAVVPGKQPLDRGIRSVLIGGISGGLSTAAALLVVPAGPALGPIFITGALASGVVYWVSSSPPSAPDSRPASTEPIAKIPGNSRDIATIPEPSNDALTYNPPRGEVQKILGADLQNQLEGSGCFAGDASGCPRGDNTAVQPPLIPRNNAVNQRPQGPTTSNVQGYVPEHGPTDLVPRTPLQNMLDGDVQRVLERTFRNKGKDGGRQEGSKGGDKAGGPEKTLTREEFMQWQLQHGKGAAPAKAAATEPGSKPSPQNVNQPQGDQGKGGAIRGNSTGPSRAAAIGNGASNASPTNRATPATTPRSGPAAPTTSRVAPTSPTTSRSASAAPTAPRTAPTVPATSRSGPAAPTMARNAPAPAHQSGNTRAVNGPTNFDRRPRQRF